MHPSKRSCRFYSPKGSPYGQLSSARGSLGPSHRYTAESGRSSNDWECECLGIQMPWQARRQGKEPESCANPRRSDLDYNEPKDFGRTSNCHRCLGKRRTRRKQQRGDCCDAGRWKKHEKSYRDDGQVLMGRKCGDKLPKRYPDLASQGGTRR